MGYIPTSFPLRKEENCRVNWKRRFDVRLLSKGAHRFCWRIGSNTRSLNHSLVTRSRLASGKPMTSIFCGPWCLRSNPSAPLASGWRVLWAGLRQISFTDQAEFEPSARKIFYQPLHNLRGSPATSHSILEFFARVPSRRPELGPRGVKKLKRTFRPTNLEFTSSDEIESYFEDGS